MRGAPLRNKRAARLSASGEVGEPEVDAGRNEEEEEDAEATTAKIENEAQVGSEVSFQSAKVKPRSWKAFFYGSEEEAKVLRNGSESTSSETIRNREDEGLFVPAVPAGTSKKVRTRPTCR